MRAWSGATGDGSVPYSVEALLRGPGARSSGVRPRAAPGPILRTRRIARAPRLRTGAHSERRVPNGGGELLAEDSGGVSGVRAGCAAGRRWVPKSGLGRDPRRVAGGLGPGQRGKGQSRWALAQG